MEGIYQVAIKSKQNKSKAEALVMNIGKGEPVGLLNFIETIEKYTKHNFEKEFVDAQQGDVTLTFADTNQLATYCDYLPKINLDQGVSLFIKWYENYYISKN